MTNFFNLPSASNAFTDAAASSNSFGADLVNTTTTLGQQSKPAPGSNATLGGLTLLGNSVNA